MLPFSKDFHILVCVKEFDAQFKNKFNDTLHDLCIIYFVVFQSLRLIIYDKILLFSH
jgi:hypothetical protein